MGERLRLNDDKTKSITASVAGLNFILHQDPTSKNHGLVLWDASIALCQYWEHIGAMSTFRGLTVLELGAGTGLLSMVLAAHGARVICTDLPDVVTLAAHNIKENAQPQWGSITPLPYCWGDDIEPIVTAAGGQIDMIVGTDVAYSEALNPVLLDSAARIARACTPSPSMIGGKRGKRCTIMLANELRCSMAQGVFESHAKGLFEIKQVPSKHLPAQWRPYKQGQGPSSAGTSTCSTAAAHTAEGACHERQHEEEESSGEDGDKDQGPQMLIFEMKLKPRTSKSS